MTTNSPYITPAIAPQIEMPSGAFRRTMGTTDRMMLLEIFVPRETIIAEHSHMHEQIGYVVRGRIEFTIGGETKICDPGDSYAVPGDILHSARAIVDTLLVEVFAPPREDFRPNRD